MLSNISRRINAMTGGRPDMTLSARAGHGCSVGDPTWRRISVVLDILFLDTLHCARAWERWKSGRAIVINTRAIVPPFQPVSRFGRR